MSEHLRSLQREHTTAQTEEELVAIGRAARKTLPRSAQATYTGDDRDPIAVLDEQNQSRLPDLVPLRTERMLASPFTFYRGTASLMALDLARDRDSGLEAVICGDAHISNFGLFASPQRSLVFDLNDFDEASIGPWEWDVKRLVTSVVIGARENTFAEKDVREAALHSVHAYRTSLRELMSLTTLQRYYTRTDLDSVESRLPKLSKKVLRRAMAKAEKRTSDHFRDKVTIVAPDGTRQLVENPPILTHVSRELETQVEAYFEQYRSTLPFDVATLISQFQVTDLVRRVVGVGSVGTRCYLLFLVGPQGESLVIQIKEAPPSVITTYGGIPRPLDRRSDGTLGLRYASEGHRVVANQRVLQAVSDPFLGYFSATGYDFYARQFRDMKGSIDTEALTVAEYLEYVDGCGALLARAHAQSANAPAIAAYLGSSDRFDQAATDWSFSYAEQSRRDYEALSASASAARTSIG